MKRQKFYLGLLALVFVAALLALAVGFMAEFPSGTSSEKAAAVNPTAHGTHTDAAASSASSTAATRVSAQPTASATSAIPGPAASAVSGSTATAVNSPAAPGVVRTSTPSKSSKLPAERRVSAAAAASLGLVPDPHSGPAWPEGFTEYRTPAEILADRDISNPEQRAQAVAEMTAAENIRYAAVLAKADDMGIPVRIEGPGHNLAVLYDFRGDDPLYRRTLNTNAAITTGANLLNAAPYDLTGVGMTAGVWDGGRVRTDHVELNGKVTVMDGAVTNDDHATHVAGTIAARGASPAAKGMGVDTRIHSYDWFNDFAEMTAAGAATASSTTKLPISNHSYGYEAFNADMGRYETMAQSTDAVGNSLPFYQIFWAAGNEQDELTSLGGYQSITFNGLAKNVVTVGAVSKAVSSGLRDPTQAVLAYFSSMGPCDDGRIKPDVVADGVDVYSSVATSKTAYDIYSGTSMATPNTTGSSALLEQLYKNSFSGQIMRASTLKALLVHTADDLGRPGPDYQYGWGLVNVKAAANVIIAHRSTPALQRIVEGTNNAGNKVQNYNFTFDGTRPIRATLVWTDPPGAAQTSVHSRVRNLVHDLDLKITAPNGDVYLPYVMPFVGTWTQASMTNNAVTGTNRVDNVERVDIAAPAQAGVYAVTVGMYGTNTLTTPGQAYSLIVTEAAQEATAPPVITSPDTASGSVGVNFSYQITADNNPEVFGATGLPTGLSVNTSTGVISGIPLAVGTFPVTLTASNSKGVGTKVLTITIAPGGAVLLWEDFSSVLKGNNTVVGGAILAWFGNGNFPTVKNAYQSGGSVLIGHGLDAGSLTTKTLNLSGGGGAFTVGFKVKGWTQVEGDIIVSVTGLPSQRIPFSSTMSGGFEPKALAFAGGQPNSTLTIATTAKRAFLDDLVIVAAEEELLRLSYSSWMSANYPQLTGNNVLPEADPDGDGFSNLLEYYMGLNPTAIGGGDGVKVVAAKGNSPGLSITYRRSKNATGVTGSVGWSSSLDSGVWSTNGITEVAIDMGTYEQVTATVTNAPGDTQKFLRLKVQMP